MHDYRFSNDRIWTAQIEFALPLEVRLAGSISFNIAEIARVTLRPRRPVVVLMRRIEMRARRHCIRRRAIAFLVNVKTVFARFEILDVSDHSDFVANFCECDQAGYLTARLRLQLRCGLCDFLCLGKASHSAKHCYEENRFHAANVRRFSAK